MSSFTPSLDKLIEQFAKLPSVGKKSAQRLAFHILSMSETEAKTFTETIEKARNSIKRCEICCNLTDSQICTVCS
jgi:recombination protein RecR